ncbi:hypothetical protein DsansV1_C10g0102871 [Dioscorea sansibarensis]
MSTRELHTGSDAQNPDRTTSAWSAIPIRTSVMSVAPATSAVIEKASGLAPDALMEEKRESAAWDSPAREYAASIAFHATPSRTGISSNTFRAANIAPDRASDTSLHVADMRPIKPVCLLSGFFINEPESAIRCRVIGFSIKESETTSPYWVTGLSARNEMRTVGLKP